MSRYRRFILLPGLAVLLALLSPVVLALDPVYTSGLLHKTAIGGYDPVAYFTEQRPVEGNSDYSHRWSGAEWQFASAENRDRFAADPERYAPQYGGYCAWAVANDYTASSDPDAWSIVDGKLYLNYSLSVREQWLRDVPGNIRKGDANWPGLKEG